MAQEVEPGPAVHLPHDSLGSGVDAFGPAILMGQGDAGVHSLAVEIETIGEAVQVGQVSGPGVGEPGGEFGVVACGRGEEFGEDTDQAGEFSQFGARTHEFLQQRGVGLTQPAGAGEQEPGKTARCDDGPIALGPALGEVAVEQVEAARVTEFLDLTKQLEDRDGRLGGAPLA